MNPKFFLFLFSLTIATSSFGDKGYMAALPVGQIYPPPGGIVFPPLPIAAGINPAALPQKDGGGTAMELVYGPPPTPGEPHTYFGSFATASKELGLGLGYLGGTGTSAINGAFVGGAMRTQTLSLGLSMRIPDSRDGFMPQTDLGVISNFKNDLTFALVMYHIETSPQISVGLGFGDAKKFNFELNAAIPPVSSLFQAGSEYFVSASTRVQLGFFGLSFKSVYSTRTYNVTQTVSMLVWLGQNLGLTVQYTSPNYSQYGMVINFK